MRFAAIVPVEYDPAFFSTYHMALAHEVLADRRVRAYYSRLRGHDVILDNSVVELGESVSVQKLVEAWEHLPDSYLILPDTLRDAEATVAGVAHFFEECEHPAKVVIVPQGENAGEWIDCLRSLLQLAYHRCDSILIGIPRLTEDWWGGRESLYHTALSMGMVLSDALRVVCPFILLGIQHTLSEVAWAKRETGILGVDSSLPGRAALVGTPSRLVRDLRALPDLTEYERSIHTAVRRELAYVSLWASANKYQDRALHELM